MIPIVKRKDYESKHQCKICEQKMDGELIIEYLDSPSYGGNYRLMHAKCWLRENDNWRLLLTSIGKEVK